MVIGLLTLVGVVLGALIARGFDRGLTESEMRVLFPRMAPMPAPTITELNAS